MTKSQYIADSDGRPIKKSHITKYYRFVRNCLVKCETTMIMGLASMDAPENMPGANLPKGSTVIIPDHMLASILAHAYYDKWHDKGYFCPGVRSTTEIMRFIFSRV